MTIIHRLGVLVLGQTDKGLDLRRGSRYNDGTLMSLERYLRKVFMGIKVVSISLIQILNKTLRRIIHVKFSGYNPIVLPRGRL